MSNKDKNASILATSTIAEGPTGFGSGANPNVQIDGLWWVPFADVMDEGNWDTVPAAGSIPAEFISHFNTDIHGISGQVGYLNENTFPIDSTNLDDLYYKSTENPVGANNIYGKITNVPGGQNNTIGWTNGSIQGYYEGSESTHDFEIYRIVTIETTTAVHLIKVTEQAVNFTPPTAQPQNANWRSAISYEYKTISKSSTLHFEARKAKLQFVKARLEAASKK